MPSIKTLRAFNFQSWIEENREKFKPPWETHRYGRMAR